MSHQLVHCLPEVGGRVSNLIGPLLLSHGGEILGRDEDSKEMVEGLRLDKDLQSSSVETQGTENARQRG